AILDPPDQLRFLPVSPGHFLEVVYVNGYLFDVFIEPVAVAPVSQYSVGNNGSTGVIQITENLTGFTDHGTGVFRLRSFEFGVFEHAVEDRNEDELKHQRYRNQDQPFMSEFKIEFHKMVVTDSVGYFKF